MTAQSLSLDTIIKDVPEKESCMSRFRSRHTHSMNMLCRHGRDRSLVLHVLLEEFLALVFTRGDGYRKSD